MNQQQENIPAVRPLVLLVLDGWGYDEDPRCNAILAARTPHWDEFWAHHPHTLIQGSGQNVGLPQGQMGNSEVGHLNLGAGRVVYQEYTRIEKAIADGEFQHNPVLLEAVDKAVATDRAVHVMGLLSPGGVHSHEEQIKAMVRLAAERGARVYVHAFLDGRDTPPQSAADSLRAMEALLASLGQGRIASLVGRYYAMDRDQRWERTQIAYELLAHGQAEYQSEDALGGLEAAYQRGETDEFVRPTAIVPPGGAPLAMANGDVVVFMNFRADRARQLTRAFIEDDFPGFERGRRPRLGAFVSLTEYSKDFAIPVAFPAVKLHNVFGEYIAHQGLRQLRIAETEKYAHVTFFFNGGEETPFPGEERILVPSPKVATYDLKPEMSAVEVTDRLVEAIASGRFDVIICNYANPDMVGHSGNMEAAVQAIEVVDSCLGRVCEALQQVGGELLMTADHGNAEQMCDRETGKPQTAHTSNPVPFIYIGRPARMADSGALSDVAPTMLYLLGLDAPAEMEGHSLISLL
ncbi:MAG: 2,3-bisphosphoglycerate-independent phosphoglycerate mutase [Gammaproteobacteria bacterium]